MFKCWKFGVCRSKACKVTSCQSWRSQEKVFRLAPAPVSQSARVRFLVAVQSFWKFAAHWPIDPKFSALKHLNFFNKHTKNQEDSSILRVVFTLSKWPHLHREWPKTSFFARHCNSKLEVSRKSLPPGPSRTIRPEFKLFRGQIILKHWWPVTL